MCHVASYTEFKGWKPIKIKTCFEQSNEKW